MNVANSDISLASTGKSPLSFREKTGGLFLALGILFFLANFFGAGFPYPLLSFIVLLFLFTTGTLILFWNFFTRQKGMDNSRILFKGLFTRGLAAWILGIVLTGFFILLYWFPETLVSLVRVTDPLSRGLRGQASDRWFLYGTIYTFAVLIMGVRALAKYRHSRYQVIRTLSVMFFQLGFAFLLPAILVFLNKPEFYFSYFWPLKPEYLYPWTIESLSTSSAIGIFMISWGAIMTFVATPVLTFFFGKRWYCSWVCGCGGLAETAGDPFRHLSDKSIRAWKVERIMVHLVLILVTLGTAILWINAWKGGALLGKISGGYNQWYGFFIMSIFSGVIGVGFYPIMGSRVWCRFGCPMAAVLGIFQRVFSRFRITTNGGQCISCGNCTKYCEMGIDVQAYAQKGQNIVRASCVGCGICEAVCPRGVLHLENKPFNRERPVISFKNNKIVVEDRSPRKF